MALSGRVIQCWHWCITRRVRSYLPSARVNHTRVTAEKFYKFPFVTFFLAGFRDCGLLELQLLVLFHSLPCGLPARPYYRTISRFLLFSRKHFCFRFFSYINFLNCVACVWISIPFGHGPSDTTLTVLRTF